MLVGRPIFSHDVSILVFHLSKARLHLQEFTCDGLVKYVIHVKGEHDPPQVFQEDRVG
jgi:hypothetical protein